MKPKPTRQTARKASHNGDVRAYKMWADCLYNTSYAQHIYCADTTEPVFVLPADEASVAQIEEQIASMIFVPLNAPKGETNRIARSIMLGLNLTPAKK